MSHQESFDLNRARWDEVVPIHFASSSYSVKAFLAGQDTLLPIESAEIGPLAGLDLVHLQCHFGLDTLNLARRGARVTGLDFAPNAIAAAKSLAEQAGIRGARFVEGNVYDAPGLIAGPFDRAYVTWGAINWLPDIGGWAKVVADLLRTGGELYLLEGHPFALALDQIGPGARPGDVQDPTAPLHPVFPYFSIGEPILFDTDTTYTADSPSLRNTRTHEFAHGIGEIIGALIGAGLGITRFSEHDSAAWAIWPMLVEGVDRMYRLPPGHSSLPLSFSLKARKL